MPRHYLEKAQILKTRAEQFWLVQAVQSWLQADGLRMSAAMSFYAMLSLAPVLVLLVAMLGWWLDRSVVESNVIEQVQALTGERTAALVQQALSSATTKSEGIIASLIATGVLLSAATGVFVGLQDSLKVIWGQQKDGSQPWWWMLVIRLRGVGYMLVFGGLLMLSLVMSTALRVVATWLDDYISHPWFWSALNEGVSFVFITLLFCGMMRISDGAKPALRHLMLGSAIGAALFAIGKHFMTGYLSGAAAVSAYGAAGSLVALLMWLYFTSAVLLLAASCAKALADSANAASQTATDAAPHADAQPSDTLGRVIH